MKKQKVETFLIPRLRRLSLWWRGRSDALKDARRYVEVGSYKNGNPIMKAVYECAECRRQGIEGYYDKKDVRADHIIPIANIEGFTNWNEYITNLFCEKEGFQILCEFHHDEKTLSENEKRLDKLRKK